MANKSLLICWRGLTEVWHQKKLIVFLVSYPLLFMLVFGSAFGGDTSPISVDVTIVTPGETIEDPLVQSFIGQFENVDGLNVSYVLVDGRSYQSQATDIINDEGATLVMFVPSTLIQEHNEPVPLPIFYDEAADQNEQSIALGITSGIIDGFSKVLFEQEVGSAEQSGFLTGEIATFIRSVITPIYADIDGIAPKEDEQLNYIDFLIPGLVAMSMLWTGVTGTSSSIVEDRVRGIRKRVLSTPTSRFSIMMGDLLAQLVIVLIQIFILLLVAVMLYDLNIVGSWWLVAIIVIIGSFSMIGIGLVVATFTKTADEASQMAMLINFPMMFLSGIFFPLSQGWMQTVSKIFPLTYVNDALRDVMIRGYSLTEVGGSVAVAVVFTIAVLSLGIMMLQRGEGA